MSTIAFDGKTVAADWLICSGERRCPRDFAKLRRGPDCVYAIAGAIGPFDAWIEWFETGALPTMSPKEHTDEAMCFIVFRKDQPPLQFTKSMIYGVECGFPEAWGSGADLAIGAMEGKQTARQAVIIAARRDLHSGSYAGDKPPLVMVLL